jgi:hypothetical protein
MKGVRITPPKEREGFIAVLICMKYRAKNLTPQPPSLQGKGEKSYYPLKSRRGVGGEVRLQTVLH